MTDSVKKACIGLLASGSACAASAVADVSTFLPKTLDGWLAVIASSLAILYSLHLLIEWYWKRVIKPFLLRRRVR
jgi:hypothetical protein